MSELVIVRMELVVMSSGLASEVTLCQSGFHRPKQQNDNFQYQGFICQYTNRGNTPNNPSSVLKTQ